MTRILGISAFYHDSAAALVVDGEIVAAAQEERFSRQKHDASFPKAAVEYCLRAGDTSVDKLDYVGFYEKPLAKFDRLMQSYLTFAPVGIRSFREAVPQWLQTKLRLPKVLDRGLGNQYAGRYIYCDHHESHAASAFFPSPFDEAAILTVDGVGEWSTATIGIGRANKISLTDEVRFPHSLGLLYSAFTYYCGFKVNSAEYKLMGLAPYGEPRYRDLILEKIIALKQDGSFRLDMSYFNYCQGLTMTSEKFHRLFGGPPRQTEAGLTQKEMDLAASVQAVTEEALLRCARHAHRTTGMSKLTLAGGVALNCVAVGRLLREGPFDDVWVQPAAGDAGGSLGVGLHIWHQLLGNSRIAKGDRRGVGLQGGSLLGPSYTDAEIRLFLDAICAPYEFVEEDDSLCRLVAEWLAAGNVVGWLQGRMEFGPRALGNRSILADSREPEMQRRVNQKIKFREDFRPFAPSILDEHRSEYFELDRPSPHMTLVAPVAASQRLQTDPAAGRGLERLGIKRSTISAATHVDYSARIQTVDADTNPRFHRLLRSFQARTGCPVLLNTSFNVRGEPIVCSPEDAYRCFLRTGLDLLVMGGCVLDKREQRALGLRFSAPDTESSRQTPSNVGAGMNGVAA